MKWNIYSTSFFFDKNYANGINKEYPVKIELDGRSKNKRLFLHRSKIFDILTIPFYSY